MHFIRNYVKTWLVFSLFCTSLCFLTDETNSGATLDLDPNNITTRTDCGLIQGVNNSGAFSFRGIPYAVPPINDRRWRPPEPTCWQGIFKAFTFGSQCIERNENLTGLIGSEDCLYLNVWTPTVDPSANLPVMVYIHGGSLQYLNGNDPPWSPSEKLARETNMVYVSMNYRLQAFGFMTLDILSQDSKTNASGNYGFMDQILSLQWVKSNIRNFGGNPDMVTLSGQSSGATSVMAILSSPLARGLFQRAWLMSASPLMNKTAAEASNDNLKFLQATGCSNVSCLRTLSAERISNAVSWNEYPNWAMSDQIGLPTKCLFDGAIAVVDGYVLKESPLSAWLNGNAIDVPLLIGTTAQETDFYPPPGVVNWTWSEYEQKVTEKLGTFSPEIAKMAMRLYSREKRDAEYQLTSMIADVRVNCGNDVMAMYAAVNTVSPVYRYIFTAMPSTRTQLMVGNSSQGGAKYSFHGMDLLAYLGTIGSLIPHTSYKDLAFQNNIRREVTSFVSGGSPSSKNWLTYPRGIALLSQSTDVVASYHSAECLFWAKNGLVDYSWVN